MRPDTIAAHIDTKLAKRLAEQSAADRPLRERAVVALESIARSLEVLATPVPKPAKPRRRRS